jgi:hypothetical protein
VALEKRILRALEGVEGVEEEINTHTRAHTLRQDDVDGSGGEGEGEEEGEGEGKGEEGEGGGGGREGGVSAYYHFDSSGRKFKNKWDEYDVDKALEMLEKEEQEEEGGEGEGKKEKEESSSNSSSSKKNTTQQANKKKTRIPTQTSRILSGLKTEVALLHHDLEKTIAYIDQVRGDDEIRAKRKKLVEVGQGLLEELDGVTRRVQGIVGV